MFFTFVLQSGEKVYSLIMIWTDLRFLLTFSWPTEAVQYKHVFIPVVLNGDIGNPLANVGYRLLLSFAKHSCKCLAQRSSQGGWIPTQPSKISNMGKNGGGLVRMNIRTLSYQADLQKLITHAGWHEIWCTCNIAQNYEIYIYGQYF